MLIDARLPDSEAGVPVGLDGRWLEQGALSLAREQYAQALRLAAGALRHARRGDARQDPSEASRDAAVFIAWSLYQMRRYQGCRRWLRYTLKTGLTEPDNLECDIIALWLLSEEGDWSARRYRLTSSGVTLVRALLRQTAAGPRNHP